MPSESHVDLARVGLSWQSARWLRESPGRFGLIALGLPPLLFFLPFASIGLFDSWRQGAIAVVSLATLALALALGRVSGLPHPTEFWLFQKGVSLADWGLVRWLLDAMFAVTVILTWSIAWTVAAVGAVESLNVSVVAALVGWCIALYCITTATLYALGSLGVTRTTDLAIALIFVALLQPVLARGLPHPASELLRLLMPPLLPAINARVQAGAGEPLRVWLPDLLHVATYVVVLLGVATARLARRRPAGTG